MCGNSLGGLVSVEVCLRYPERVAGLVLAGSAGIFERSLTSGERPKPSREFVRSIGLDIFADEALITDEMVEEWYQSVLDRDYVRFLLRVARATRDWRLTDDLQRLDLPTLIVWGRDDKVTPPAVAEEFSARSPVHASSTSRVAPRPQPGTAGRLRGPAAAVPPRVLRP